MGLDRGLGRPGQAREETDSEGEVINTGTSRQGWGNS